MPDTAVERGDLLGLDGLPADQVLSLLDQAEQFLPVAFRSEPPLDLLAGGLVANLFFEDSTRTRCSFTVAAKRLGADTVDLTGSGSSLSKGETLLDTALNVEAMGVDAIVVRSPASGSPAMVARAVQVPVINAGDGQHEHPTQALLDIFTLRRRWGDVAGRTVAIVGDIGHSRVARSNAFGLTTLGADVVLVGPPSLVPRSLEEISSGPGRVTVSHDLDEVLGDVDAVMMLRVQLERQAGDGIPEDYRACYGLTVDRAVRLRPEVPVMHPGPMNRGVEIDSEVADDQARSVILRQVTQGVALRMAVLERAIGHRPWAINE
ncbi:MAG: aspartate carbamoyltransferase catalytic subunit [Planctomycetota bacterium]|jgi:aspartate carbamoyltransferase catalytic subunit